jgi:hypothetical protein
MAATEAMSTMTPEKPSTSFFRIVNFIHSLLDHSEESHLPVSCPTIGPVWSSACVAVPDLFGS